MSGIQHRPYVCDEQPGRKAWCACGESANQPYCDGSHARKNTGKTPVIVEIAEAKKVAWCGCRQSKTKPYCDGTHRTLPLFRAARMRKSLALAAAVAALAAFAGPARAEDYTDRWGVGLDAGVGWPFGSQAVRDSSGNGAALGGSLIRGLTPNWRAALNYENIDLRGTRFEAITGSVIYAFLPEERLTPYVGVGLGSARATHIPDQPSIQGSFVASPSVGLEYAMFPSVSGSAGAALYHAGNSNTGGHEVDAVAVAVGLTYWIGGPAAKEEPEAPEAAAPAEIPPAPIAPTPPPPAVAAPAPVPPPPPAPTAVAAPAPAPVAAPAPEIVTIDLNVQFEKAKDVVRSEYEAGIGAVADFLKAHPAANAEIQGYTDAVGSAAYNTALSQRRADSVRRFLIEHFGIEASRLTAEGYGPDNPIADNSTPEGRAQNRRVVATIEAQK